jgi:hypothetical protein
MEKSKESKVENIIKLTYNIYNKVVIEFNERSFEITNLAKDDFREMLMNWSESRLDEIEDRLRTNYSVVSKLRISGIKLGITAEITSNIKTKQMFTSDGRVMEEYDFSSATTGELSSTLTTVDTDNTNGFILDCGSLDKGEIIISNKLLRRIRRPKVGTPHIQLDISNLNMERQKGMEAEILIALKEGISQLERDGIQINIFEKKPISITYNQNTLNSISKTLHKDMGMLSGSSSIYRGDLEFIIDEYIRLLELRYGYNKPYNYSYSLPESLYKSIKNLRDIMEILLGIRKGIAVKISSNPKNNKLPEDSIGGLTPYEWYSLISKLDNLSSIRDTENNDYYTNQTEEMLKLTDDFLMKFIKLGASMT